MTLVRLCLRGSLLAAAVLLPVSCFAQSFLTSAPPKPSVFDVSLGYATFHPADSNINDHPYHSVSNWNATGSLTGFWNKNWGFQLEGGYFSGNSSHNSMGQCNPACSTGDQSIYTAESGPVFRWYPFHRWIPYLHATAGAAKINGPVMQPLTWGWAATVGGGLDYVPPILGNHVAFRLPQFDLHESRVNYGPTTMNNEDNGGVGRLFAIKVTAGVVIRIGSVPEPEQTVKLACSAVPAHVMAGEPVALVTMASGVNLRRPADYALVTAGGRLMSANTPGSTIDTAGLIPGMYTVEGKVTQGRRPNENASCVTRFEVKASPAEAASASAALPAGAIPASAGSAGATDPKLLPAVPPRAEIAARPLCSASFERDRSRPLRVDNEAKGCLDDIALTMSHEVGATLVIIGEFAPGETSGEGKARAINVKAYLSKDRGVNADRIRLRWQSGPARLAENTLLPLGVNFDGSASHAVVEDR